ncbi:hypothetical protein XH98_19770 [Bradyrhizobium sp. CCBAU 51745]|nr:hypothetical protein [Bradyrhizobium sp. CCBAU 51745]
MLSMLLDAIYGEVISASVTGMKAQGPTSSAPSSTAVTSAAWLPELIEALDNVAALPPARRGCGFLTHQFKLRCTEWLRRAAVSSFDPS